MTDREDRIRARAYQIWEREGCLEGHGDEHWQRAVQEIDAEDRKAAKPAKKAPTPRKTKATAGSEDRDRKRALAAAKKAAKAHGLTLDEVMKATSSKNSR